MSKLIPFARRFASAAPDPAAGTSRMSSSEKFISIEGIARRYPAPGGKQNTVFENLWLPMRRGEFVCMIGHSGCGKTTVLNILAGLEAPSEGVVIVDGQAIEGTSLDRAVIFQGHAPAALANGARERRLRGLLALAQGVPRRGRGACPQGHRHGGPRRLRA